MQKNDIQYLLLYLTRLITLLSLLIKLFLNENDAKEKIMVYVHIKIIILV